LRDHRTTSAHVRALAIAAALALPTAGAATLAASTAASAQVVSAPALSGHSVSATEGHSKDFHVADASGLGEVALSDVSVDWGDGSAPSTGALSGTQVHATHTYAEAGTYTVTVTAAAGDTPLSTTATATIDEATVNLHHELAQVIPGGAFDGTVADGTDHNDSGSLSDFSAVVDWGDGSAPLACTTCIVATAGGFDVDAAHSYATAGLYHVLTMVEDGGNDVHENPVDTVVVVPIVAAALSAAEGTEFSGTVGSVIPSRNLTVVAPAVAVPSYNSVSIDWGDGSDATSGVVAADGTVSGTHAYAEEGTYTLTLDGTKTVVPEISVKKESSASNTVTVTDAPLTGTASPASPFSATVNTVLDGVFGNVVDTNPGGKAGDLSATIDWGDGSSSAATLVAGTSGAVASRVASGGGYNATGTHTYSSSGTKNGVVHFVDAGGATASVPFTVTVAASQVQGITNPPIPTGGNPRPGGPGVLSTPNTGADLPITTAALLVMSGASLFAVGRRRRS
jgi:large repetitive protein